MSGQEYLARFAAIGDEISNATRLAAKTGDADEVAHLIGETRW